MSDPYFEMIQVAREWRENHPGKPAPRWKIVCFPNKRRKEVLVEDPRKGLAAVKILEERGIKAHLVSRVTPYEPRGKPEDPEQLWCPLCRRWRFFRVPRNLSPWTESNIRICQWCLVSETYGPVFAMNVALGTVSVRKKSRAAIKRRAVRLQVRGNRGLTRRRQV